jgi:assimilatory nitrate reductase catalytic subunit
VAGCDPKTAAAKTGIPPENIEKAAHWFARADRAIALHARGIEHQSKGVENCLAVINIALATGHLGREGSGCSMITGQGNGQGGREHGQKCDQLPGQRMLTDPAAREHVAGVWGISPDDLPQPGYSAEEIMEAIHRGEIKALLCMCFNPLVSLPDSNYTREALEKLEFFGVIDSLCPNCTACRCSPGRQSAGRRRRACLQRGRPRHPHPKSRGPAP